MALFACKVGGSEGSVKVTYIGSISGGSTAADCTKTFNVTSKLPNYNQLTANNFFMTFEGGTGFSTFQGLAYSKNYNASTGILTIVRGTYIDGASAYGNGKVYYISEALPTS